MPDAIPFSAFSRAAAEAARSYPGKVHYVFTAKPHISGLLCAAVAVALQLAVPLGVPAADDSFLFKTGFSSYNRSDYAAAISTLTSLLEKYPDTFLKDTVLLLLARSHLQSGDRRTATALTERLLREFPDRYTIDNLDKDLVALLPVHVRNPDQQPQQGPDHTLRARLEQPDQGRAQSGTTPLVTEPEARERLAWERIVRKTESAEKAAKVKQERADLERLERKRRDAEKAERERLAQVKADKERREAELAAADRADLERLAMLRTEEQRRTAEREELERVIAEKRFNARLKAEQAERERAAAEQAVHLSVPPPVEIIASPPKRLPPLEQQEMSATLSSAAGTGRPGAAEKPQALLPKAPFELSLVGNSLRAEAGRTVAIPFTITNRSSAIDRYRLESGLPAEFAAWFADAASPGISIEQTPPVASGKTFKGVISITVPGTSSDGSTCVSPVKVFSVAEGSSFLLRDLHLTTSSPLLRALIKPKTSAAAPGEKVSYAITVINAGSAMAGDVTLRLACPPSFQAVDLGGTDFRPGKEELVLDGFRLAPGEIRDISITFRINAPAGREDEYYCRADLVDNRLQTRISFLSGRLTARKP